MKKALWVVVAVVVLAGCNVTQPPVANTGGSVTAPPAAVQITKALIPTPQATTEPATLEPTEETALETDAVDDDEPGFDEIDYEDPTTGPDAEPEFQEAGILDTSIQDGSRLSDVAVSNDLVTYYRMDVEFNSKKNDYRYDYYTRIMRLDKKTGKCKEFLNTKGKGFIFDFYLHDDGSLYYVLGESICPEKPSRLCRYQKEKARFWWMMCFRSTRLRMVQFTMSGR